MNRNMNMPTEPAIEQTLPYAPTYKEAGGDIVPQTEAESQTGLLAKIHLSKLALVGAVLNAPGAVASIATHEPVILAGGAGLTAMVAGETLHSAHNYFRNGYKPQSPINRLIKAKSLEKQPTSTDK
jgi:hypothetical protein